MAVLSRFCALQVECCATSKHPIYNRKIAMRMPECVPSETSVHEVIEPMPRPGALRFRRNRATTSAAVAFIFLALLSACDSNTAKTPQSKPEAKPTELLTGRAAFQKVFIAARNYAADVKPFRIESTPSTDSNGQDGKSTIWRASFASATRHSVKPFIWSGTDAADAPPRGVSPGNEDTYNPSNASTQIFDVAFLKVDSDQAFAEAQKHGGDKILAKDAATPVIYICDWNHNTNELTWHVIYGGSREDAKLTVAINASSGAFTRVEK
jgi:hypothetical protein